MSSGHQMSPRGHWSSGFTGAFARMVVRDRRKVDQKDDTGNYQPANNRSKKQGQGNHGRSYRELGIQRHWIS